MRRVCSCGLVIGLVEPGARRHKAPPSPCEACVTHEPVERLDLRRARVGQVDPASGRSRFGVGKVACTLA